MSDPIATLKFLNNLLNAAVNSVSLNEPRLASNGGGFDPRGDIRSAQFIRELIKFGFEVAKVNPTVTTTGATVISEFLNTLWKGGDDRKGQGGLNQFFEGVKTGSDRVKLLGFGDRLVDAAQLLQDAGLQTQKRDAKFLSQLLNLGRSYATFRPSGTEDLQFFLDTLWKAETPERIDKGSIELEEFLENFESDIDRLDMLKFERNLLTTLRLVPDFQGNIGSSLDINDLFNTGISYAVLESAFNFDSSNPSYSNEWFSYIWNAKTVQQLETAANYLQRFVVNSRTIASSSSLQQAIPSPTEIIVLQFLPNVSPTTIPKLPTIPPWLIPPLIIPGSPTNPLPTDPQIDLDWRNKIDPITNKPYKNENEFILVTQSTPKQREELARTPRNKSFVPYLKIDSNGCIYGEVPRQGGNVRHNSYATYLTGVETDFYVLTPEGKGITYDGHPALTKRVWEVKAPKKDEKGSWLNNAISKPDTKWGQRAQSAILALTQQRADQLAIAVNCGYDYKYATASEGLTRFLNKIWGNSTPVVQYIKYPDTSYLTKEGDETEYFPSK